ncbi:MAG TPA: hypothetical protein VF169_05180 [Albitalea sp.]|uniref:hypothetical protein n=1 Tax=Piscinibacter sp. TaxID=1903157 RepID=UPI002ED312CD
MPARRLTIADDHQPEPGNSMSQQQFEAFMAAQIAAIQASGAEPDAWIERHSTTFRSAWEDSHAA